MSLATTSDTLLGRFNTQFTASQPTVPIHWNNVSSRPADARATWVFVQLIWGENQIQNSGPASSRRVRRSGLFSVSIFTPPGEGIATALAVADSAEAAMRLITVSGVRILTPSTVPNPAEETYFSYIVTTPFIVDVFV